MAAMKQTKNPIPAFSKCASETDTAITQTAAFKGILFNIRQNAFLLFPHDRLSVGDFDIAPKTSLQPTPLINCDNT